MYAWLLVYGQASSSQLALERDPPAHVDSILSTRAVFAELIQDKLLLEARPNPDGLAC